MTVCVVWESYQTVTIASTLLDLCSMNLGRQRLPKLSLTKTCEVTAPTRHWTARFIITHATSAS